MKDFIKGAIFGAVVTGVVVALTTPKRGTELRDDIATMTNDLYTKGIEKAQEIKEESEDIIEEKKEYLTQKLDELANLEF